MKKLLTPNNLKLSIEQWVWFFIWFTLPISIRLNSLSILLGSITLLIIYIRKPNSINNHKFFYLSLPMLLFLVYAMGVFGKLSNIPVWKELEQMLPLLAIPIMFLLGKSEKESFKQVSLTAMVLSLTVAGIIMLCESAWVFLNSGSYLTFIYHDLASPFTLGAIYMSFFLLVTLFQINELRWLAANKRLMYFEVGFFLLLLLLLASKLLIIIGLIMLILKFRRKLIYSLKRRKVLIPIVIIVSLITITPMGIRLKEIANPNLQLVNADKYYWDSPLNGFNLRLIQLRLGTEILNENNAWLSGVGIDNSQKKLDNKYISYGIYTGYEGTEDTGYLGYNFHNQFMETLVRSGAIGLLLLISMFVVMAFVPNYNRYASYWILATIFMFFLTESVMERQQGIVYFCLIYSSYFPNKKTN